MSRLDGSGEGDLSVTPLAERPIRPLMPKSLARDSRRGKEHHPFHSFTEKVKVRTVSHPQKFPKMFSLKGCVCVCVPFRKSHVSWTLDRFLMAEVVRDLDLLGQSLFETDVYHAVPSTSSTTDSNLTKLEKSSRPLSRNYRPVRAPPTLARLQLSRTMK